jgi:hypothetical protein
MPNELENVVVVVEEGKEDIDDDNEITLTILHNTKLINKINPVMMTLYLYMYTLLHVDHLFSMYIYGLL